MIPTKEENPTGLHQKYVVTKADGSPVNDGAEYFVLRLDHKADVIHRIASLEALAAYTDRINRNYPVLANDLRERYLSNIGFASSFINAWRNFTDKTYSVHKAKGFANPNSNDGEQIALMHSELSEALEGLRKDLMDDKLPHRKMVEVELADVVIRIMNYAVERNLDIPGAMIEKNEFNATRSYMHGGKKF